MNPVAFLLALLATVGAASALRGGRDRGIDDDNDGNGVDGSDSDGGANGGDGSAYDPDDMAAPPLDLNNPVRSPAPDPIETTPDPVAIKPGVAASVMTGRVSHLELPADMDVAGLRVVTPPSHGNVTVNSDGTLSVVLSDTNYVGPMSFTYEVRASDGTVTSHKADLSVQPGAQQAGWGLGDQQYMLATDDKGELIVETGENHRSVYISNSNDALSREEIAALEGIDPGKINGAWLAAHPKYGASEGMALKPDVGMELWYSVTGRYVEPNSNWLLFERGYTYDDLGQIVARGTVGESELHPVHITSWGEGDRPVLDSRVWLYQSDYRNIVFSDVELGQSVFGMRGATDDCGNIIFDDVRFTGDELNIQIPYGVTIRNSEIVDIYVETPRGTDPLWATGPNKIQGAFFSGTQGVLIENSIFDYNSWREGYDPTLEGGDAQPPSLFNHNLYMTDAVRDATVRGTIFMRAASYGAQFRGGAFIEDNAFIDNNVAFITLGGDYEGKGPVGNYSLVADNLVTSASYKDALIVGALAWGLQNGGADTTLLDNIVAHLADPNNPLEEAAKDKPGAYTFGLENRKDPFYDDTIVYNWRGTADQGIGGLNPDALDQTTIQRFIEILTGDSNATIGDFGDYLRALSESSFDDSVGAEDVIRFFQQGFGIDPGIRTAAETLVFEPDVLGDGMRWDNRINWSTDDLPGTVKGDSVDLNGNHVYFGGTARVDDLDFGSGGKLVFNHGRLTVDGDTTAGFRGGDVQIDGAGQFWMDGYRDGDRLDVDVDGGRFVNTGNVTGAMDLSSTGGQAILATGGGKFAVTAGSRLEVLAGEAKVGFDGSNGGQALLGFSDKATLAFDAEDGKLGSIGEFRSGAFGDAPNVKSGISLDGRLQIDLSDLSGNGVHTLISADEIVGAFKSTNLTGLGSRNAELIVDYATDTVRLSLVSGTGAVKVSTIGAESNVSAGDDALWKALTATKGTWDDQLPDPEDEEIFAEV